MVCLRWVSKDPEEVLDYYVDLIEEFEDNGDNDQITNFEVLSISPTTAPPLVVSTPFIKGGKMGGVWLSGGSSGVVYKVDLKVTTYLGRIYNETVSIRVINK